MGTRTKILITVTVSLVVLALTELVVALIVFVAAVINHGDKLLGLAALLVPVLAVIFTAILLKTDISKFIEK